MKTRTAVAALALALLPALAAAEPVAYKVDGAHSSATFTIRHFVSEVDGRFKDFDGTIKYDKANPSASTVAFNIRAASIDTDNANRDKHLSSPDFFDVAKFPTLTFASTSVSAKDANTLNVTGNLTIHGVTKAVTVPVAVLGTAKGMGGADLAAFKTSFTINRQDYGVAWNRAMEGGGSILSDDVTITIRVESHTEAKAAK